MSGRIIVDGQFDKSDWTVYIAQIDDDASDIFIGTLTSGRRKLLKYLCDSIIGSKRLGPVWGRPTSRQPTSPANP